MALKSNYYQRIASEYDRKWQKFSGRTHQVVLDALPMDVSGRVLDIGCGTGALLERLIQLHPDIRAYGIDTSAAMLAEAGEKLGSRATLLIQDSEWLPEFSEPFDVIISSNVLHYIENPADWLGQLSHLLKSDGVVILQDFSKSSRAVRYGTWLMRWLDPQYRRAYSAEEAQAFSSKAGLSVQRVATFPITWWYEGWLISS